VLVCGGDGSVSWVLNEIDRLGLQKQVHYTSSLFLKLFITQPSYTDQLWKSEG